MPPRTNVFQQVVAIIHEHMAEGATVEESAMLTHRVTGRRREVDVVIRTKAAAHEILVGVEATAGGRMASVEWVERMIGKHQGLPTDKLVLVAEAGFRPQAREVAHAAGVATFAPADLDADDPALQVIEQLRSLWPKFVSFLPREAWIWVDEPDVGLRTSVALPDLSLFLPDGIAIGPLHEVVGGYISANFSRFMEEVKLVENAEEVERYFVIEIEPGWTVDVGGSLQRLHVRDGQTTELLPIEKLRLTGKVQVRTGKVELEHRRLGEIIYGYGEGTMGDEDVLVVTTEGVDLR